MKYKDSVRILVIDSVIRGLLADIAVFFFLPVLCPRYSVACAFQRKFGKSLPNTRTPPHLTRKELSSQETQSFVVYSGDTGQKRTTIYSIIRNSEQENIMPKMSSTATPMPAPPMMAALSRM